jgi:hypothetical protein
MNAKLSMENPDWYTPTAIVEAARAVLGGIDLDPASDAEANLVIQATTICTEDDSGLYLEGETLMYRPWVGRVFVNPPGGMVKPFWNAFVLQWLLGHMTAGIWIGYSLEQLQSLQNGVSDQMERTARVLPTDYPMCVPEKRLMFEENDARRESRLAMERVKNQKVAEDIVRRLDALADTPFDTPEAKEREMRSLSRALARTRNRRPKSRPSSPTHGNYIVYAGSDIDRFVEVFSAIGACTVPR